MNKEYNKYLQWIESLYLSVSEDANSTTIFREVKRIFNMGPSFFSGGRLINALNLNIVKSIRINLIKM